MAEELKKDEIGAMPAFSLPETEYSAYEPGLTIREYAAIKIYASLVSSIGLQALHYENINGAIDAAERIVKKLEQTK